MKKVLILALPGFASLVTCMCMREKKMAGPDPCSALVEIRTFSNYQSKGRGFFVDTGGLVITAVHVICGEEPDDYPDSILVITSTGRKYRVKSVLAMDIPMDICLVKVDCQNRNYLFLADHPVPGSPVVIPGPKETRTMFSRLYTDEAGRHWGYLRSSPEGGYSGSPVLSENDVVGVLVKPNGFAPVDCINNLLANANPVDLREAHRRYARTPYGYLMFSDAVLCLGDTSKAILYLRKAANMEPSLAEVHNNLGFLLKKQGKYKEARGELEKAAALYDKRGDPENARGVKEMLEELPK